MKLKSCVRLMRPHQYLKNFFIFLPLFFALKLTDMGLFLDAFIAFIAFSLSASAVYIFNDYRDMEEDRQHPKKKERPLASGAVTPKEGLSLMVFLLCAGFVLMAILSVEAVGILLLYLSMNAAYSIKLKHISIVDVMIIAIGFVLRLFVGSAVTDTPLSMWIVLMTFLLALFLALAKRRDDVMIYLNTGKKMRKVLDGYNLQFLDTAMSIMAAVVLVAYVNYTTSPEVVERVGSHYLYLTSFFVILGVLRYLKISLVLENSGSPTKIVMKDRFMQLILAGWVVSFAWILY